MKRFRLNLNLTGVIVTVAVGVLLPVMLLTAVGIVAIVFAKDAGGIVHGVLVLSFAVTAIGSGLIAVVLTGKKARLARRQADFVAGVSHELRTPLSAIRLYAQTLQSGKLANDPERTEESLATILRETEWLDHMIDGVLTWRTASDDRLPMDLEEAAVTPAIEVAVERFRAMIPPEDVDLSCASKSRNPVPHDPRAMQAVILNLLTNAYKYTGNKKVIGVRVSDEDGGVVIAVSDNGIGLSATEAKRVFHAFYRVEQPGGINTRGVGLGLAIAHHLIQRQGGTLAVESEPGKGSVFTIRLPGVGQAS
jgi:signal transduction histidine kinase